MKKINVLIVDDSAFMRKAISSLFEQDQELHVIGIARNGQDAIEKIIRLKPDVVTMDIDMPVMDGITALEKIMVQCPVPVVMLSNINPKEVKATISCTEIGAIDFFIKEKLFNGKDENEIKNFIENLKAAAEAKVIPKHEPMSHPVSDQIPASQEKNDRLIIIGTSTGGPSALQAVLPHFNKTFPIPIVVIQHMPKGFTQPLADRFNSICKLRVKEVDQNGEELKAGTIYIAPAGYQTTITEKNNCYFLKVSPHSPIPTLYNPSVDVTLLSAAPIFKEKLLSVILTGMGQDGLLGCKDVKNENGTILVQSEDTCVVYGMPKVVYEEGIANSQIPIEQMYEAITNHI